MWYPSSGNFWGWNMKNQTGRLIKSGLGYAMALAGFITRSCTSPGGPVSVAIEPGNICNLRCPLCAAGAGELNRPKGSMKLADFKKVINMLPESVTDLYLWGQGEPFMVPDFLDMVHYASSHGFRTFVSTNGHFLKDYSGIIKSGLYCLIVSLDGTDKETYEFYRKGGNFDLVINGIKGVAEAVKNNEQGPLIKLQCLVTQKNVGDMEKFISLGYEIGVDRVVFKTLQAASIENGEVYLPDNMNYTRYRKDDKGVIETDRKWFLKNRCLRLYYSFQIDWQGNVLPCCFDKNSNYRMGNIFDETVYNIWNSDKYRSFRNMLNKKGRILSMCKDCTEGLKQFKIRDLKVK